MDGLYRRDDVLKLLNVSRTTLWRMEREGLFPRAVQISERRKGYLKSQVDDWFSRRSCVSAEGCVR
jgi:prophage regulatory protein